MSKTKTKHIRNIRGIYYLDYRDPRLGNNRVIRKYGTNKKEAEQALAAIMTDIARNQYNIPPQKQVRFADFAKNYMEKYSRPNKRSWKRDEVSLVNLLDFFGAMTMDKILPFTVERYRIERKKKVRKKAVKNATVNREVALLKHMLTMAVNWGMAWNNPLKGKGIKQLPEDNKRIRFLTQEEEGHLLNACSESLKPIVMTALLTGMRLNEILSLKWDQVNLSQSPAVITVIKSKSGKPREIPICKRLADLLSSLKGKGSTEYVFISERTGKPYKDIKTAWHGALRRSGIAPCTFHDLRHTYGTFLVNQGVPLPTVMKLMGHSSITMTMRYAHSTPKSELEAVAHLENMLPGVSNGKILESSETVPQRTASVSH